MYLDHLLLYFLDLKLGILLIALGRKGNIRLLLLLILIFVKKMLEAVKGILEIKYRRRKIFCMGVVLGRNGRLRKIDCIDFKTILISCKYLIAFLSFFTLLSVNIFSLLNIRFF